jgi:hypothetical protein
MTKKETSTTYSPFLSVQQIRLADVFVVSPFCFYVASQKSLSNHLRIGLFILGISTLLYNGNNYLKNRK